MQGLCTVHVQVVQVQSTILMKGCWFFEVNNLSNYTPPIRTPEAMSGLVGIVYGSVQDCVQTQLERTHRLDWEEDHEDKFAGFDKKSIRTAICTFNTHIFGGLVHIDHTYLTPCLYVSLSLSHYHSFIYFFIVVSPFLSLSLSHLSLWVPGSVCPLSSLHL